MATAQLQPARTGQPERSNIWRPEQGFPQERFATVPAVPVFCEHQTVSRAGKPLRYSRGELAALAENCNRRVSAGNPCPLTDGHTPTPEQAAQGMPQPEVMGYATNFRLGTVPDPEGQDRDAILADFHIYREDLPKVRKRPYRSVETWLDDDYSKQFFSPIALLGGVVPRLDLGAVLYGRRADGAIVERYTASIDAPEQYGFGSSMMDLGRHALHHAGIANYPLEKVGQHEQAKAAKTTAQRAAKPAQKPRSAAEMWGDSPPRMEREILSNAGMWGELPEPHAAESQPTSLTGGSDQDRDSALTKIAAKQARIKKANLAAHRSGKPGTWSVDPSPVVNLTGGPKERNQAAAPGAANTFTEQHAGPAQNQAEGETMLAPEDVKAIVDAIEQLPWVQWVKDQMQGDESPAAGMEDDLGGEPGMDDMGGAGDQEGLSDVGDMAGQGGPAPASPPPGQEEPEGYIAPLAAAAVPAAEAAGAGAAGAGVGGGIGAGMSLPEAVGTAGALRGMTDRERSSRPGEPERYARLVAEVNSLRGALAEQAESLEIERGRRVDAERYSQLSELRRVYAFDLDAETERCNYSRMDDERFVEHLTCIQENYRQIPLDVFTPAPAATQPPQTPERYARLRQEVAEEAREICEAKINAGEQPDYMTVYRDCMTRRGGRASA